MGREELPLNPNEQIEVRRDAVMGAIEDELGPRLPALEEILVPESVEARIDAQLAQIRHELGCTEEEAEVILAERMILQRKLYGGE